MLTLCITRMDVVWETPQTHNKHKYTVLILQEDDTACHTVPCYDTMTVPWWENGRPLAHVPEVSVKPRLSENSEHSNTIRCECGCLGWKLTREKKIRRAL